MRTRLIVAATSGIVLTLALACASPSSADPKKGTPVELICSDGNTYQTLGSGQGEFSPVHDINSTAVFIPTWMGEQIVTGYAPDGSVVFSEDDPPQSKGGSSGNQPNELSCSFTFTVNVVDQHAGPLTIVGSGTVIGFKTS